MPAPRRAIGILGRCYQQVVGSRHGIAAVEFALVLPILFTLIVAAAELSQAMLIDRNVDALAKTLIDITSRETTCPNTNAYCATSSTNAAYPLTQYVPPSSSSDSMETIFAAAAAVMGAAPLTTLTMTLTAVDVQPVKGT